MPLAAIPRHVCLLALVGLTLISPATAQSPGDLEAELGVLNSSWPGHTGQWAEFPQDGLSAEMQALDRAAERLRLQVQRTPFFEGGRRAETLQAAAHELVTSYESVESLLDESFDQRNEIWQSHELGSSGEVPQSAVARLQGYLRATGALIALSGRMREHAYAAVNHATLALAAFPEEREAFIRDLVALENDVTAEIFSYVLPDPGNAANRPQPASRELKNAIFAHLHQTRPVEALPLLAAWLVSGQASPEDAILAAEAAVAIGLPQPPSSEAMEGVPAPALAPKELTGILEGIDTASLSPDLLARHTALLSLARERGSRGIEDDSYTLGNVEFRPGDWLLIRNPSPYNLFTTLSPGLFTHVGVVTDVTGDDGIRRFVVTDIRERGSSVPATNIESFVQRTLHWIVLRHDDLRAAEIMARRAEECIGLRSRFDLTFHLRGVQRLANVPLKGRTLDTYCAGFLLLCSQETGLPLESFFPVPEQTRNTLVIENLHRLGMKVGEELVTPTGPLFANQMDLVGRQASTYDPGREIEQAVFDRFAQRMVEVPVHPNNDLMQDLRVGLAEMARGNQNLATILASMNDVDAGLDLAAAAQAAAVVETLDGIAYGQSGRYRRLWEAFFAGPRPAMAARGLTETQIADIERLRQQNADLWQVWVSGLISPLELRRRLVTEAIANGRAAVDARFFESGRPGGELISGG